MGYSGIPLTTSLACAPYAEFTTPADLYIRGGRGVVDAYTYKHRYERSANFLASEYLTLIRHHITAGKVYATAIKNGGREGQKGHAHTHIHTQVRGV